MNARHLLAVVLVGTAAACGARTGLPVPDDCPSTSAKATRAPLDVFFLVDASRSMTFVTDDGSTKWQGVRDALGAFLAAKDSAGIGAAITFFPHIDPSIPDRCGTDAECGLQDACQVPAVCMPDPGVTTCATEADCASGGACKTIVGICLPNGVEFCASGADCGTAGDACTPIGTCDQGDELCIPGQIECARGTCGGLGTCENHIVCATSSYAAVEAPVAELPGSASAILAAMDAHAPDGATPTLPALGGALDGAEAWAKTHPAHKVVVVLATDGLPTTCDDDLTASASSTPLGVANVAAVAADGAALGIATYVIGVFAPDEKADATVSLDQVAKAGATGSAFLIDTSDVVSTKLLDALTAVRDEAGRCAFATTAEAVAALEAGTARLELTHTDGDAETLSRVSDASACASDELAYFVEPTSASDVGKIDLCPSACDAAHVADDIEVSIVFRCAQ